MDFANWLNDFDTSPETPSLLRLPIWELYQGSNTNLDQDPIWNRMPDIKRHKETSTPIWNAIFGSKCSKLGTSRLLCTVTPYRLGCSITLYWLS